MSEPYPLPHPRTRRQHGNSASGRASSSRGLSVLSPGEISPERPRKRTKAIFAKDWQVRILKKLYQEDAHPSDAQKCVAAAETGLDVKWIGAWFQRHNNPNRKNSLAAIAADGLSSFGTSASSPDTSSGSCPPEPGPSGSGVPVFQLPFPSPANFNSAGGWAGDQTSVLDSNRAAVFSHPPGHTFDSQKDGAPVMLRGPGVNATTDAQPYHLALPHDVDADSPYRPTSSSSSMIGNTAGSSGSSSSSMPVPAASDSLPSQRVSHSPSHSPALFFNHYTSVARPVSFVEHQTSFSSTGAEHHAYSPSEPSASASLGHSEDPRDRQPMHLPGIQSMLFNNNDEHFGYPNASPALLALSNQIQSKIESEDIVAPRPVHYTAFVQAPGLQANNNALTHGRLLPSHFPAFLYPGSAPGLAFPVPDGFPFPYQHANTVTHKLAGERTLIRHPPPPIAFLCRFEDVSALARRLRSTYYANTERAIQDNKAPLPSDQNGCESRSHESTFPNADDEDKENLPPAAIEQSGPDDLIDNNVIPAIPAAAPLPARPTTACTTAPDAAGAERRPAQPGSRDAADAPPPVPDLPVVAAAGGIES